jgi:4-diphosphocytidyl-2-C-methyl-D-erythritol kinase
MTLELLTPAKINLGLEVVRRRDDGYHDIATVFQTVSVFDRIRVSLSTSNDVRMIGQSAEIKSNLAVRALDLSAPGQTAAYHVEIEKRIPIAAGLGGASADAAAILRARAWFGDTLPEPIEDLALQLGSDVPFLLNGGAAVASGRGEVLEPVPSLRNCWIVLVTPEVALDRKTARLYGTLTHQDFSDGSRANAVADALRSGTLPQPSDLSNAFVRPLTELLPDTTRTIADALEAAGAPFVALSGAGPTPYTIVRALPEARSISTILASMSSIPLTTRVARPVATGMQIREEKTSGMSPAL